MKERMNQGVGFWGFGDQEIVRQLSQFIELDTRHIFALTFMPGEADDRSAWGDDTRQVDSVASSLVYHRLGCSDVWSSWVFRNTQIWGKQKDYTQQGLLTSDNYNLFYNLVLTWSPCDNTFMG